MLRLPTLQTRSLYVEYEGRYSHLKNVTWPGRREGPSQTPVTWRPISRKSVKCVTILETSALIMNIIMKLIFGIYMKNSYFFHISLNIGRSDMKQTAKNSVRSMLSYPFTLLLGFSHILFFFFLMLPFFFFWLGWITHWIVVIHLYTKVHTPRSIHQATFKGSNVHTPAYFYVEKNSKWPLF